MNFKIHAASKGVSEIDIFGEIGQSWFDEGNTLESVRADLSAISENDIVVNISSLGGDIIHGLAIHDILKAHKGKVTTRMIGATASAGTVIAAAGDEVEISDNTLFLVHHAWTMSIGNAEALRKTANDLDKFDSRIINIYKKKTGKGESEIKDLMKQEKWIDANEAKEWGFVNTIYTPIKAEASITLDPAKLEAAGLPKLPEKFTNKINTDMKNDTPKSDEKSLFEKFKAFIKAEEVVTPKADEKDDKIAELEATIAELKEKIKELEGGEAEASVETPAEPAASTEDNEAIVAENTALKEEVAALKAKVAKASVKETKVVAKADPDPVGKENVLNEGQKIIAGILKGSSNAEKLINKK